MHRLKNKDRLEYKSLGSLFCQLKRGIDEVVVDEIYRRTYVHMFHYIHPKVYKAKDTFAILQDVYKILCSSSLSNEQEVSLIEYLERIADSCLLLFHSKHFLTSESKGVNEYYEELNS